MAKDSPKRQAAVAQIEELRKQGMADEDIRHFLKRYNLSADQLDDLLPSTADKDEPPVPVVKTVTPQERRERLMEVHDGLLITARSMSSLTFNKGVVIADLNAYAKKLRSLL